MDLGWVQDALELPELPSVERLAGGNSNETLRVRAGDGRSWILRRPPAAALGPGAHSMEREHRILAALAGTAVPAPRPVVLHDGCLLMEDVPGVALTTTAPAGSAGAIGEAVVDALAALHTAPWRDIGLADLGRPDGFLERQVPRWRSQLDRHRVRELPGWDAVTAWLEATRPRASVPALMHGDFHVDNCLVTLDHGPPRVAAIIDWETATIGDGLLDLGLLLAFWGDDRPARPAFGHVQGFSRGAGAPSREALAARYAQATGRDVADLRWWCVLAFVKLAAIVEGAYAQHLAGRLDTPYAAGLRDDVPALVREAAGFAGLDAA